jgi:hypothetical protein
MADPMSFFEWWHRSSTQDGLLVIGCGLAVFGLIMLVKAHFTKLDDDE